MGLLNNIAVALYFTNKKIYLIAEGGDTFEVWGGLDIIA
jgi:hypothetical protein